MLLLETAYLAMDLRQFDAAQDMMLGAAALMPRSEVPLLGLGAVEFNQRRFDKAAEALRRAQKAAPRASTPRAHLGEALLFLGKMQEAEQELTAAVKLEPESDGARFAQALLDAVKQGLFPPSGKVVVSENEPWPVPEYPTLEGYIEVATEEHVPAVFADLKTQLQSLKGPRAEQGKKVEKALEHAERMFFYLIQVREKIRIEGEKGAPKRK